MWSSYITDANKTYTPHIFRASREAVAMHNCEVSSLEQRNSFLETENKKLRELLKGEQGGRIPNNKTSI